MRDRNVLRLYYADGLTLEKIGVLHGVNLSTVQRWIKNTQASLLTATRARLREQSGISPPEFESLSRALMSQIELSIRVFMSASSTRNDAHS